MSDLIDFDAPSSSKANSMLSQPLIPAPDISKIYEPNSSEAGPHFSDKRQSIENNPFDMVMKEITEYEKNKEDPFERVIEKTRRFSGKVNIESQDDLLPKRTRHSDILKLNKTMDESKSSSNLSIREEKTQFKQVEGDISIITDLNNTNLIDDKIDVRQDMKLQNCDNNRNPTICITPLLNDPNLSILNDSAMDDSLLGYTGNVVGKSKLPDLNLKPRSMSQTNVLSLEQHCPKMNYRRSVSVSDAFKNCASAENSEITNVELSSLRDPFNDAFEKSSCSFNSNSLSSNLNILLNLSEQRLQRLNSDSSVSSGISNISTIPMNLLIKQTRDRFCSASSALSISNLSSIHGSSINSTCDTSTKSNDVMNKGFLTSNSQLNCTNSTSVAKTPSKLCDNSDLIKKFYEIKTRMSTSEEGQINFNCKENTEQKCTSVSDEKLIDVDNSNAVFTDEIGVNDIILHEAKVLAETFENMALGKESSTTVEDDLFFSKAQLNFDDLPPSDDDTVDNLIDLPVSPLKDSTKETSVNSNMIQPEDNIKALEHEFIEPMNPNKKATAMTLLLDLEKLIKEENNPPASKVLKDLEKLLGIECDNNTEMLQVCLQNSSNFSKSDNHKHQLKTNEETEPNDNHITIELNKNVCSYSDSKSNDISETKENSVSNVKSDKEDNVQLLDNKEDLSEASEDQKLAANLLRALNKIVKKESEDSTIDIFKSLGTVLNMATELRTKNKNKQKCETKPTVQNIPKLNEQYVSKSSTRTSTSFRKYPSPRKSASTLESNSFEILPLRKSISVNPISNSNNFLNVPQLKDKRKSHLLHLKKRFPSDPGLINLNEDKKKSENCAIQQSKPPIEPIKTKLKKTTNSEAAIKKGPLKAVIPLGNMQKRGSLSQRISTINTVKVTPPKTADIISKLDIPSSTPNTNGLRRNAVTKPKASSTPNTTQLQSHSPKPKVQLNTDTAFIPNNLIPVSKKHYSREESEGSKIITKRLGRSLSPHKKISTCKKSSESGSESKVPRYSPRPARVRNYSMNDLMAAKTPQSAKIASTVSSEKKVQRNSVSSPLRNCNKLTKSTSSNLISRLGKPSNIQLGPEKENYA